MDRRAPLVYYCLCVLFYIIALPFLIVSSFRAKHKDSIPARFFPFHIKRLKCEPKYWFHACSFGEVRSLEPLINALKSQNVEILITTITHTGFKEAKHLYESNDKSHIIVRYLPFEIFLPLWSKSCKKLKTLVVTEAEMWKMLFFIAKSNGARTMLINARISVRSQKNYEFFSWFYRGIFALIDEVLAQSQADKERLKKLGGSNIEVFGNLKTLNPPSLNTHYDKPSLPLFTAASTHRGEEKLILQAFKSYKEQDNSPILLLVPRHPERFREVYELSLEIFSRTALFSQEGLAFDKHYDVIVIDTLGELNNLYAISDLVILGGGFATNVGGHNPFEPAFFGVRLISGEHIFNQHALFEEVENYVLLPPQSLADTLMRWKELPSSSIKVDSKYKLDVLLQKIQNAQR